MFRVCLRFVTWFSACLIAFTASSGGRVFAATLPSVALPQIVISAVQTGGLVNGAEDGRMEFVELYNPGDVPVDVTDWALEYLAASNNGSGAPTRVLASLEGQIVPGGHVLLGYQGYWSQADVSFGAGSTSTSGLLARSGGHVRLVDADDTVVDLVGWGSGVAIGSWWHAPEIPAGSSIQRILPGDPAFTTGSTFASPSSTATPQSGGLQALPTPTQPICTGIALSELLPNPTGTDAGQEFIEVYNQADTAQSLKGCALRLGMDGRSFALPDEQLAPHAYRAFSDTETGITLPNAVAQTVWLLTSDAEQGVAYPDAMADGQAWALIGGTWQSTLAPTPNATNMLLAASVPVPKEETTLEGEVLGASYTACPAGKERNPATNRCRTIVTEADPAGTCAADQSYNPDTHRCRLTIQTSTGLKPCTAGQERNPDTGRCRSVIAANSELTACPTGQERNAQTNRCHKTSNSNTNTLAKVQDVQSKSLIHDARVWMAAAAVAALAGYGIYEWRQEILRIAMRLRAGKGG